MRTLLMLPLLLLPFTAQAASLLPGGDYPAPDCRSPLRPLPGDSPMDWRMYRSDMEAYRQCVEAYLATARQDAERIRKRMEKAVREYNEESGNLYSTIPPHANLTYGGPLRCGAINAERRSSFSEAPPHIRPTDSNLFDIYSEALRTALRHPSEAGEPIPRDVLFRNRPPLCSKPTRRHTARSFP